MWEFLQGFNEKPYFYVSWFPKRARHDAICESSKQIPISFVTCAITSVIDLKLKILIKNCYARFKVQNFNQKLLRSFPSGSPFDDLSDAASPFSDHGSLEGATGYNSSLDGDHLKGATGGYGYTRGRGRFRKQNFKQFHVVLPWCD